MLKVLYVSTRVDPGRGFSLSWLFLRHSTDQVILDIQNLAALAAEGAVVVLDDR
jgi:hypothetical protein